MVYIFFYKYQIIFYKKHRKKDQSKVIIDQNGICSYVHSGSLGYYQRVFEGYYKENNTLIEQSIKELKKIFNKEKMYT